MTGAVVVVSWGSCALLERHLVPLSQALPEVRVVVVDSWSGAQERARVRDLAERRGWQLVAPDRNTGFGVGADLGVAAASAAGCDAVLLLNPDATADPATVRRLLQAVAQDDTLLLSPVVVTADGEPWFREGALDLRTGRTSTRGRLGRRPGVATWVSGACLAVSTRGWQQRGGFDPRYFLYWEDVELSLRWQRAGGRVAVDPDLVAVHDVGGTQGPATGKTATYVRWNCRDRLLLAADQGLRTYLRWLVLAPSYAWEVVRRGGRRRLLRRPALLLAAVRGTVEGAVVGGDALRRRPPGGSGPLGTRRPATIGPRVRLYQSLRTAHLEQALALSPATILYQDRRYDFDERLAARLELVRAGPLRAAWLLLRSPVVEVEVNEPLMRYAVRSTALAAAAARVGGLLRRRPVLVVTYCIELFDYFEPGRGPGGAPRLWLDRWLARLAWRLVDRVVWGTPASREFYERMLPDRRSRETLLLPTLPQRCDCPDLPVEEGRVVFLGAFSGRKGFPLVLRAWPLIRAARPAVTMALVGQGRHEADARRSADGDDRVSLRVDPPREEIHRELRRAQVVVLPSQADQGWREQLGLPLTEGLAHGCSVVTTDQTGLAGWLAEHGHRVLAADAGPEQLAEAVVAALDERRDPCSVLADLPRRDGRLAADDWLFSRR